MADLGDISGFLKEGNVANLDWLDIDEKQYQELETLPKQNLDVVPDLEALWSRDDSTPLQHLPNREGLPKTMGDLSEAHGFLRSKPEDIRKIARLVMMQSSDPHKIQSELLKRFDKASLRASRDVLASVFAERGLLGRFYVDASDFPGCHKGSKQVLAFVKRYASEAKYVLQKSACDGCACSVKGPTGCRNCATFHKELRVDLPYTEAVADKVEALQQAKGKALQAGVTEPKERIRLAMLAPTAGVIGSSREYVGHGQPKAQALMPLAELQSKVEAGIQAKVASETQAVLDAKARSVVSFLRRELLKGRSESEAQQALKLAFQPAVLDETAPHWVPLMKQAGVFGVVFATQESFSDCHEGSDFLAKHNAGVRVIVRGSKCGSCIYAKANRCLIYGKSLVASLSEVFTQDMVEKVLTEHKYAGRIASWDNRSWGSSPLEALRNIHAVAIVGQMPVAQDRLSVLTAYHGQISQHKTTDLTKRDIVLATRQYMNEGLYGADLLLALKARFDPRDLQAAALAVKPLLGEQGLQGIYYVDPEVYDDYGKGCDKAASLHRSKGVPYVKVGSKCGSCIFQTKAGFCSKINKPIVAEPPYADKAAQRKAILASGRSTQVNFADLINNGHNMMLEFELQHREADIELNPETRQQSLNISFK